MRRMRLALLTALTMVFLFVAALPATATSMGKIRAFHNSPDTPAVDVYVNGSKTLSGVAFGTVSSYLSVPQGTYQIAIRVAGAPPTSAPALSGSVYVGSSPVTVAAIGSLAGDGGSLRIKVLRDRTGIWGNWALVRVAHTSPDAPAVDVQLRLGRYWVKIITNLSFGQTAGYLPLPATNPLTGAAIKWDLRIVAAGTNTVVLPLDDVALPKGRALTVWATGFLTPNTFGIQITPDGRNAF